MNSKNENSNSQNSSVLQIPSGFRFTGAHCGIKPDAMDLALIVADRPCVCAGVYTQNLVRAASIDWNRSITPSNQIRAIAVNSGNANACTGEQGVENNRAMAAAVADVLECDTNQVPILSTGVIGHQLPIQKIEQGIATLRPQLGNETGDFELASQAILTTDRGPKTASVIVPGDNPYCISGMAKGAGMIGPKMATMLSVIVTDAELDAATADACLRKSVDLSFNQISVDGHTSTNDAVMLMCSGAAGPIDSAEIEAFGSRLTSLCMELAKKIPSDGEGSTHLIEINVSGAKSKGDADLIARTVASSNLVKTAVTGADPNWGRIVSAAGYSGADILPEKICLRINQCSVYENGSPVTFDQVHASQSIRDQFETFIELVVGDGPGMATHWTSDLTHDYVTLNAEYTT